MRIVIDTNIAFSAILNTNGKIGKILLHPKSKLNFYATNSLKIELEVHKDKLLRISGFNQKEFEIIYHIIISKIRFINAELIPLKVYNKAIELCNGIDEDDTEFVALTEHAKAKLWTGDKILSKGLEKKGWKKIVSTSELYELIKSFRRK